jgi:hypothetical protein
MTTNQKKVRLVLLIFISLHIAVLWLSPANSFLEADTMSYLTPADALSKTGAFLSETRLPGYPLLLAGLLVVTRRIGVAVVMVQALLLFITGLVASRLAETIVSGAGLLTLVFVCFNPAASFCVQQILPDTLFAFFLILHIYFSVHASHSGSLATAINAGMAAGATALIRGNGQYVIWLMPLALSAAYALRHEHADRLVICKLAATSILAACFVCSPWLIYNWRKGEGVSFISRTYADYSVHDNVVAAIALQEHVPIAKAREVVYDIVRRKENIQKGEWEVFTAAQKYRLVRSESWDILLSSSVFDLSRAIGKAVVRFFFLNDGQTWATFWQLSAARRTEPEIVSQYSLSAVLGGKGPVSAITYAFHGGTLGFVLLMRIFGVIGAVYLARKNLWYLLAIFGAHLTLFTLSAGFIGYSRYRVPIDPVLLLVAAVGALVALRFAVTHSGKHLSFPVWIS